MNRVSECQTELNKCCCLPGTAARNTTPTVPSYICTRQHIKETWKSWYWILWDRIKDAAYLYFPSHNFCLWDPQSNNLSSEESRRCGGTEARSGAIGSLTVAMFVSLWQHSFIFCWGRKHDVHSGSLFILKEKKDHLIQATGCWIDT